MLATSYVDAQNDPEGMPNVTLTRAGGGFGIVAAFLAWYNVSTLHGVVRIYVACTSADLLFLALDVRRHGRS